MPVQKTNSDLSAFRRTREFVVCYPWMNPNPETLVYSPNLSVGEAIAAIARRRGLAPVVVDRAGAGLGLLHRQKFPAVILDCGDNAIAADFLEVCRHSRSNKSAVVIALTDGAQSAAGGASFCIRKSPDLRELVSALRTAEGMILREFKRYRRSPVMSSVVLDNDEHRLQLKTVNLSEGGMCVFSEIPGWNREHLVHFDDSELGLQFHTRSIIVWRAEGKSGIQFQFVSPAFRSALADWLQTSGH